MTAFHLITRQNQLTRVLFTRFDYLFYRGNLHLWLVSQSQECSRASKQL